MPLNVRSRPGRFLHLTGCSFGRTTAGHYLRHLCEGWRVLGMLVGAMPRLPARTGKDAHRTGLPEAPKQGRPGTDGWLLRQEMVDCGKAASGRCRKCANGPGHGRTGTATAGTTARCTSGMWEALARE